jgi:hypothetical protein
MQKWTYRVFQSTGGTVTLPSGNTITVVETLNQAGSSGGELVAVVNTAPNVYEW